MYRCSTGRSFYTGEQVVLIENEFGEIGIDGGFLKDAGPPFHARDA